MTKPARTALSVIGILIVLLVIVITAIPMFLNTDSFRTRIETTLTNSLGRKVTISKLSLSIWSGGMVADKVTVADDPRFSNQSFIQADSVKISVELIPLILSRQVHVRGFDLQSPQIQLLRAANGTWNYSTIGNSANKPATSGRTDQADLSGPDGRTRQRRKRSHHGRFRAWRDRRE